MKKKKHPKLPNGFGSIKTLSGKRSNPYGVYPPTKEFIEDGSPVSQKALCYVDDWYKGFYVLMAYKNGTYSEKTLEEIRNTELPSGNADSIINKIIAEHNRTSRFYNDSVTFSQVYEEFFDNKYNKNTGKKLSEASKKSTRAAFKNCSSIHNAPLISLRAKDFQKVVDDCTLKHASKELIVILIKQMCDYAVGMDIIEKNYAEKICVNAFDDDEKGIPFTIREINILWDNKDDRDVKDILIMIYSGFRIAEYPKLKVDTKERYFQGGVKTQASKDRIVPISTLIHPFVDKTSPIFTCTTVRYRQYYFYPTLEKYGIKNHTPHDCRHTFSWLCDKYGVDNLSKKMLLGHSLGSDVTDARYGHRTLEELREQVDKLKHW